MTFDRTHNDVNDLNVPEVEVEIVLHNNTLHSEKGCDSDHVPYMNMSMKMKIAAFPIRLVVYSTSAMSPLLFYLGCALSDHGQKQKSDSALL